MKVIYTVFILAFSISVYGQQIDTLRKIDELFARWNNATPGGSVLVARNNTIIYHKAFGLADLEHNAPNTTETIFESGSVAKQFTATSILLLASKGKLSLQDDVRKYVPELPIYQSPITIQHLLNHTSGLKDWGTIGSLSGWPRTTRMYTQDLALQIMCRQKTLNFTPGSQYSYSNSNYSMLVTIVERVSKQSLQEFTDENFFKPLGMNYTQWRDNFREVVPNRAIAYSQSGKTYQQNMPFENVHGHGGLLTTTEDLLTWNNLLETKSIGGEKVYAWRVQQGKLNNGKVISYASGISVNDFYGKKEISHSGATAGYRAWLAYYPEKKISIVVLSNDAGFGVVGAGQQIAKLYLGVSETTKKPERNSIALQETDLKRFAGIYRSTRGFDVLQLELKDGAIVSNDRSLKAAHRDTLFLENMTWSIDNFGSIILNNGWDTNRYVRVNPPKITSLQKFSGVYTSADADVTFTAEVVNSEIWLHNKPLSSMKLTPVFLDGFRTEDYELVEFTRDKKGNVTGFYYSMSRAERVPFVKKK